jgi:large subunit ribosomal protein L25
MSKVTAIAAQPRSDKGTRASRRLRNEGLVPAVLYGHGETPAMLSVTARDLENLLRHGGHGLLNVECNGKTESAVIKEVQFDTFGVHPLHVDFSRVSAGERVRTEVEVVLKGTSPGVANGGVLNFMMHSLEIECPAENILEQLPINISGLELNKSILVKDVKLPEGMKILNDPDVVVVAVAPPVAEAETAPSEAGVAEPEVIRREAKPAETAE